MPLFTAAMIVVLHTSFSAAAPPASAATVPADVSADSTSPDAVDDAVAPADAPARVPKASPTPAVLLDEGEALLAAGDASTARDQADWLLRRGRLDAADHIRTHRLKAAASTHLGDAETAERATRVVNFITAATDADALGSRALSAVQERGDTMSAGVVVRLLRDAPGEAAETPRVRGFRFDTGTTVTPLSAAAPVSFVPARAVPEGARRVWAVDARGSAVASARFIARTPGAASAPEVPAPVEAASPNEEPALPVSAERVKPAPALTAPPRPDADTWRDRLLAPWPMATLVASGLALGAAGLFSAGALGYGAIDPDNPDADTFVPVFIGLMGAGAASFALALVVGGTAAVWHALRPLWGDAEGGVGSDAPDPADGERRGSALRPAARRTDLTR